LIFAAFALPVIPLALAWRAFIQQRPGRLTTMALGILSASYVWVLAVLAGAPVIAPHYTAARSTIIDLNADAVLVAVVLVVIGRRLLWKLLLAGFGVLVLWAYIGFVDSVV
jgi:branched-subunit amino acid transport protein